MEKAVGKKPKTVFVCSMADLFGEWVPDDWIMRVFWACEVAPQHRYLFLTKNPARYENVTTCGFMGDSLNLAEKWYGTTITGDHDFNRAFDLPSFRRGFLSIEPLRAPLSEENLKRLGSVMFEWAIIGAESGTHQDKVTTKREWIEAICAACDRLHTPVFMKNSLIPIVGEKNMRREFPWEVSR